MQTARLKDGDTTGTASERQSPVTHGDATRGALVVAVVLNWCGYEVSRACVESLLSCAYEPLEVLIVDNGSPDGSGAQLNETFPDIPYLQTGENLGYAGGNNRGIAWALERGAAYVLVLNNDTVVDADAVTKLVEAAQAGDKTGAVAPKILYHDDPERIWFAGGRISHLRAIGEHLRDGEIDDRSRDGGVERVSFVSGCCLLLPAEVARSTGGFAEDLFAYVEDVDLSLRLTGAGLTLLYQPEARILHHTTPAKAVPTPFQIVLRDRNRRRVAARRFHLSRRIMFRLFFYPSRIVHLLAFAVRGDLARAAAIWRGMTVR